MVYVTRRETFSSAHKLYNENWNSEKNDAVFDKCANPNGHGHNYTLEVTVAGEIDPETGYLVDLKKLKAIIRESVIQKVDHKHLNYDVDFLKGTPHRVRKALEYLTKGYHEKIETLMNAAVFESEMSYFRV
ncbi:MAG: 6-carboxytetrahydropterin synthase [Ignavibacteriales bacterium]|nr:6-carboxytetrahydropterin synthase [Ignavibacteriales bacterium]